MPLNVACIFPILNSCDYGGIGGVICGYDGDENDDDDVDYDDDAGDDNYVNQDQDHNDEGTSSSYIY